MHMTEEQLRRIAELVEAGAFASNAEFVRRAIDRALIVEERKLAKVDA